MRGVWWLAVAAVLGACGERQQASEGAAQGPGGPPLVAEGPEPVPSAGPPAPVEPPAPPVDPPTSPVTPPPAPRPTVPIGPAPEPRTAQVEGACGTVTRTHVAAGSTVTGLSVSRRGRTVVAIEGTTRWVMDVASGTLLRSTGRPIAFTGADEAAVLYRTDPATGDSQGRVVVEGPLRAAPEDLFGFDVEPWVLRTPMAEPLPYLAAQAAGGRSFLCDLAAGACHALGQRASQHNIQFGHSAPPHPLRTLRPDGTGFAFWDAATNVTVRVADVATASLLPDGSAVFYRDAAGLLYALRHGEQPLLLGDIPHFSHEPVAQGARSGLRALLTRDGRVVTYDARTGAHAEVAQGASQALLDPTGERLLVQQRTADGTTALRLLDLVRGTSLRLMDGAAWASTWSGGGRFVSVLVPDCQDVAVENCYDGRSRLFRALDGQEVPLAGGARVDTFSALADSFQGSDAYLVQSHRSLLQVYDTATGALLKSTLRGMYAGEYPSMTWSAADGWFYGTAAGRFGPPDREHFAWNPRTGEELTLGVRTDLHCVMGERRVFGTDLIGLDYVSGPLAAWSSATATLTRLSEDAKAARCFPARTAVTFIEGTQAGGGRGVLVYRDLVSGCRQVLAEDVEGAASGEDFVVAHGPGGVVHVTLPRQP